METTVRMFETAEGALPAQVVDADELPVAENPEVGQIVAVYSRGRYRAVKVTKVGPKRLQVTYTTEGARDTAIKIAQINRTASVDREIAHGLELAADYRQKADAIDAGEIGPDDRDAGCIVGYRATAEEREAKIAQWRAEYPAQLREWADAYEAKSAGSEWAEGAYRSAAEFDGKPFEQRVVEHTHTTTKSVKREEVYAL